MWHLLVLTGARIGEVLALTRADLLPDGLLIDESALDGHPSTTEHKKSRTVPIPASLRSELEEWLAEHNHSLMFPTQAGKMHHRGDLYLREVVKRARSAAKIPDLTFRCAVPRSARFSRAIPKTRRKSSGIIRPHSRCRFTRSRWLNANRLRWKTSTAG
jgi:integrase